MNLLGSIGSYEDPQYTGESTLISCPPKLYGRELRRFIILALARGTAEDVSPLLRVGNCAALIWEFPKIRVPCSGVLIIRILLFRVLY